MVQHWGRAVLPGGHQPWQGLAGTVAGKGSGHVSDPVPGAHPAEPIPSRRCAKSSRTWVWKKNGSKVGKANQQVKLALARGSVALWMWTQKCHFTRFCPLFDCMHQTGTAESVSLERD